MAAPSVLLKVWRHRLSLGVPGRRSFWGGKKKQDQPSVVEPVKDVYPVIDVCPPPRSRKYLPPEHVQNHLESRVREIWGASVSSDWQRISLADVGLKYRLLAQMAADLDHTVPNNQLHQMKSVGDVLDFYSTPIKDISKLDELGMQELPSNLKINWTID
ncbi:PREDICTED: 39S ribosomal protein L50, mitochondrial [Thamnophis sirtalis]|uniref:Large ribosomal subunit protein mL50 n=1 Tax=Thamnophis sirtalis TaxID=35019 RepID=A0A6I9YQK6_9SAUR|nr:PREDICTED: 39S ribosomal protein L50, mitochondrial [Thamnophis sirtalis]